MPEADDIPTLEECAMTSPPATERDHNGTATGPQQKHEPCLMQPCPKCGEADDIARKCWGCYINYCNVCATLYEVFPGQDAKTLWRAKQKGRKGRRSKSR